MSSQGKKCTNTLCMGHEYINIRKSDAMSSVQRSLEELNRVYSYCLNGSSWAVLDTYKPNKSHCFACDGHNRRMRVMHLMAVWYLLVKAPWRNV